MDAREGVTRENTGAMEPRQFLCRVYWVKKDKDIVSHMHEGDRAFGSQTWEVRADTGLGFEKASVFYHETDARSLPPLDSLIRVTIDELPLIE